MNYDYSKRVWATDLKGGKLLVMLALAQHADPKGECYPSADTLAAMARLTDRQVRRVLNALAKSGHIVIEQRAIGRGKKPSYKLFPEKKADKMSTINAKAEEMSTIEQESGQNVHLMNGKADISDAKSGHFDTVKADISAPIQSHAGTEHQEDVCLIDPLPKPIEGKNKQTNKQTEAPARDERMMAESLLVDAGIAPATAVKLAGLGFDLVERAVAAWFMQRKATGGKLEDHPGIVVYWLNNPDKASVPASLPASWFETDLGRKYSSGRIAKPSYQPDIADIPGVVFMPPTNGHVLPPTPIAHPGSVEEAWAIALAELQSAKLPWAHWLTGSFLQANGELAGEPFYRLTLTEPGANAEWMKQQAESFIRRKLASILGKRITLEITTGEKVEA